MHDRPTADNLPVCSFAPGSIVLQRVLTIGRHALEQFLEREAAT